MMSFSLGSALVERLERYGLYILFGTTLVSAGVAAWKTIELGDLQHQYDKHLLADERLASKAKTEILGLQNKLQQLANTHQDVIYRDIVKVRDHNVYVANSVPIYLPASSDVGSTCNIPRGAVLLLNSAASGLPIDEAPRPAGRAETPDETAPLNTIISTTTANLGTCREVMQENEGWLRFYNDLQKAMNKDETVSTTP